MVQKRRSVIFSLSALASVDESIAFFAVSFNPKSAATFSSSDFVFCKVSQRFALFFVGFAAPVFLTCKMPNVQTGCRKRAAAFLHRKRASNLTIQRSFIGAPPGTRTLGPLIKRASRRFVSKDRSFESSLFLIKTT